MVKHKLVLLQLEQDVEEPSGHGARAKRGRARLFAERTNHGGVCERSCGNCNKPIYAILIFACIIFAGMGSLSFAQEEAVTEDISAETTPAAAPAPAEEKTAEQDIAWIDGKLPDNSTTEGLWQWDDSVAQDGIPSHTYAAEKGRSAHSFQATSSVGIDKDSKIVQYVFLDLKNTPDGIMLKFFVENKKDALTVYWEGDEEVFADMNEYISAWYMGVIPVAGEWIGLKIDCKELDISQERITGVDFIANNGKLWWGKTIIKKQGGTDAEEKT